MYVDAAKTRMKEKSVMVNKYDLHLQDTYRDS